MNLKDLLDRSLLKNGKLVPNLEPSVLKDLIIDIIKMMET